MGFRLAVIILLSDVFQINLEIPMATTAHVKQSVTLAAFVIEGSVLTWDEFRNVSVASNSDQVGLREQGPEIAKRKSRTQQQCSNHQEQGRTGHGKVIERRR